MFTNHDRRGRHRQAARNLTIAVATAALAGGGAAMAADGGAAPPTTKVPAGGVEPTKTAQKTVDRLPLAENEPVVIQARAALGRLVVEGAIDQAEADVVLRDVIAGSVEPDALVRAGEVSSAHMPAIMDALMKVKRANAPAGDADPPTTKAADGGADSAKQAREQGDRQPLAENEPVVIQARARLQGLVADGAIDQAEADVVLRGVIAGTVYPDALVRAGKVSSGHMPAINDALREVKRANAPAGDAAAGV